MRTALRKALHEALGVGLALGLAACSSATVPGEGGTGAAGGGADAAAGGAGGKVVAVGGAGGQTMTGGQSGNPDTMPPPLAMCDTAGIYDCAWVTGPRLARVTLAQPFDYMALRNRSTIQEQFGQRCDELVDSKACEDAILAALPPAPTNCGGFDPCTDPISLVVRTGSKVVAHQDANQIAALLAPIQHVDEAALIAQFAGLDMGCGREVSVQCREDVFEVRAIESGCLSPAHLVQMRIPEEGSPLSRMNLREAGHCAIGRLPDQVSLADARPQAGPVEAFLHQCTALEAASVPAFLLLAADLEAAHAPADLVARAREAAADEIEHAALMGAFACRQAPVRVEVARRAAKPLFELACENAVEGCIRETYGAAVAAYQAQHAGDASLRTALTRIAEDEARHAALSHAIAAWAEPLLTFAQRAHIRALQAAAIIELRVSAADGMADAVHDLAGMPRPEVALRLLDALDRELWADA